MMRAQIIPLAACAVAACALVFTAAAAGEPPVRHEIAKLLPWDEEGGDFGHSVAAQDDLIVIGAPWNDESGSGAGAAFVFRFDGSNWVKDVKLLPHDGQAGDHFGYDVALDGDRIVVSTQEDNRYAAYVFRHDGQNWIEEAKLVAADDPLNEFGKSVTVDGDTVVVGAIYDDDGGYHAGAAYVFHYDGSTWTPEAKLVATDAEERALFGFDVDLEGDRLLIGAIGHEESGEETGAGYVYERVRSSWVEKARLFEPGYFQAGRFVSLDGDRALIGAPIGLTGQHGALLFEYDGEEWDALFTFSEWTGRYGYTGCLAADTVMVGAPWADETEVDSGAVFVYRSSGPTWRPTCVLLASDPAKLDCLSSAVAWTDGLVLAGAPGAGSGGAAYLFSVPEHDCNGNGVPDDEDIANGTSEDCNENGVPDECDIADLTSWDCNHNGIPDECDIASGHSQDVNSDGIPDECWFPGDAGVLPLLQMRTLWVHAICWVPPCEDENSDAALDFSPYDSSISAACEAASATAAQHSVVGQTEVWADGDIETDGMQQMYDCVGEAENVCQLAFGAPYAQSVLLRGQLDADAFELYSSSAVDIVLSDHDGVVLFQEEVYSEGWPAGAELCHAVECQEEMAYMLRVQARARGGYGADSQYSVRLTALGDVDGDWDVDTADLLALLGAWGPQEDHPADFDGDGDIDTADLLALLGNWGP